MLQLGHDGSGGRCGDSSSKRVLSGCLATGDRDPEVDGRPALIYFSSADCAPCRWQQAPILASLRRALGDRVRFEEVDAVAHPDRARQYRVLTLPTTVVVAPNGEVVAINYGVTQARRLSEQLARAGA